MQRHDAHFPRQILTDRSPFQRNSNAPSSRIPAAIINRVQRGERPSRKHDKHNRIPDVLWAVMERCWAQNPTERHTAHEAVEICSELVDCE
jgi:hypothetical protein